MAALETSQNVSKSHITSLSRIFSILLGAKVRQKAIFGQIFRASRPRGMSMVHLDEENLINDEIFTASRQKEAHEQARILEVWPPINCAYLILLRFVI